MAPPTWYIILGWGRSFWWNWAFCNLKPSHVIFQPRDLVLYGLQHPPVGINRDGANHSVTNQPNLNLPLVLWMTYIRWVYIRFRLFFMAWNSRWLSQIPTPLKDWASPRESQHHMLIQIRFNICQSSKNGNTGIPQFLILLITICRYLHFIVFIDFYILLESYYLQFCLFHLDFTVFACLISDFY